jgi:ABC-2 type transport system ATP-binding protein
MLISSHRLDEVATLVNRVVELDQGEVVLDDRVADLVDLSSRLFCRIHLVQPEAAFAKAIGEWGFQSSDNGLSWEGFVAGPDRLRFLGVLSRYAALLAGMEISEAKEPEASIHVC